MVGHGFPQEKQQQESLKLFKAQTTQKFHWYNKNSVQSGKKKQKKKKKKKSPSQEQLCRESAKPSRASLSSGSRSTPPSKGSSTLPNSCLKPHRQPSRAIRTLPGQCTHKQLLVSPSQRPRGCSWNAFSGVGHPEAQEITQEPLGQLSPRASSPFEGCALPHCAGWRGIAGWGEQTTRASIF